MAVPGDYFWRSASDQGERDRGLRKEKEQLESRPETGGPLEGSPKLKLRLREALTPTQVPGG